MRRTRWLVTMGCFGCVATVEPPRDTAAPVVVDTTDTRDTRDTTEPRDTSAWVDTDRTLPTPKILVVVLDDIGTDQIGAYAVHPTPVATPSLDALAARGVLFDNAIGEPVCSSARAALLTGRNPYRLGVGMAIPPEQTFEVDPTVPSLPRLLTEADPAWHTVAVGKWHLTGTGSRSRDHALRMGFQHHHGTAGNLVGLLADLSGPQTYTTWDKLDDGRRTTAHTYATTDTTDDAIAQVTSLPAPWLVYVAYHAAHFPWHVPPDDLIGGPITGPIDDHVRVRAMIASADHELGRLLDAVDDDTWVVVLSDNGSSDTSVESPWRATQSKGTLYRGGVRIPLLVSGPGVRAPGRRVPDLVQLTDVLPTLLDLGGAPIPDDLDGTSFAPLLASPHAVGTRQRAYAEKFQPLGAGPYTVDVRMMRDDRYKLIRTFTPDGTAWIDELYDLVADPLETTNLLAPATPSQSFVRTANRLAAAMPR